MAHSYCGCSIRMTPARRLSAMTTESVARPRGIATLVLAIRFLTELALLAGLAVAGARLGGTVLLSILGGVLAPAVAATIWGLVIAPRARRRLAEPTRFVLEFVLFALAGIALAASGLLAAGIVLAVAGIGFAVLTRIFAKDG
ncbi:MAG: YrdB family protein [Umezawaea sp.]